MGQRGDPLDSPARPISRPALDISDGSDATGDEEERDGQAAPTPQPALTGDLVENPATTGPEPPAESVTITQVGAGEGPSDDPGSSEQPPQSRQGLQPVGPGGPGGTGPGSPQVEGQTTGLSGPEDVGELRREAAPTGDDRSGLGNFDPEPVMLGDPNERDFGGTQEPETFAVPLEQKFPGDPSRAFMEFTQTARGEQIVDRVEQALAAQMPAGAERVAQVLKYPVTNYLLALLTFQSNRTRPAAMQLQRAMQNLQSVIQQDLPNIG